MFKFYYTLLERKPRFYKIRQNQSLKPEFLIVDVAKRYKALDMANRKNFEKWLVKWGF